MALCVPYAMMLRMSSKKPQGRYNPSAAVTALRKRAEAVAAGSFEAELRHLAFLAGRLHEAVASGDTGWERDATREFGLQLRSTTGSVKAVEEALAERVADTTDWKAAMSE